jgi:hypothetical protein
MQAPVGVTDVSCIAAASSTIFGVTFAATYAGVFHLVL